MQEVKQAENGNYRNVKKKILQEKFNIIYIFLFYLVILHCFIFHSFYNILMSAFEVLRGISEFYCNVINYVLDFCLCDLTIKCIKS